MRIVNETAGEVHYEIKGGPLRMTMSTCDLSPGEEEVWRSPYRGVQTVCEVHVEVAGTVHKATVAAEATLRVTDQGIVIG